MRQWHEVAARRACVCSGHDPGAVALGARVFRFVRYSWAHSSVGSYGDMMHLDIRKQDDGASIQSAIGQYKAEKKLAADRWARGRSLIAGVPAVAVALLGVISCASRTTSRQPDPTLASSAASAEMPALVAYADGSRVCFAELSPEAISVRACAVTPAPISSMVWRNPTELVVLLEGSRVGIISGVSFSELGMPDEAVWAVPRPQRNDVPMEEGSSAKLVVSERGEIWLGRCAWVVVVDEPACEAWVFARLSGPPAIRRDEPRSAAGYGPASPPSDIRITVERAAETGKSTRIRCERGPENATFTAPAREGATSSAEVAWLASSSPPSFLLTVAYDYIETVHEEVFLMRACDAVPSAELGALAGEPGGLIWGPRGFFVHRGESGWVVRAGDRVIGSLPESEALPAFRP